MSQQQFSIYELDTGHLTGAMVTTSNTETMAIILDAAVPAGCGVVLGWWDQTRHAVDTQSGTVIEISPAEPDWREQKGVAASAAYAEIVAAEAQQARPMREVVDALISGLTPPEDAMARFTDIKTRIEAARLKYQSILAAETEAELSQIES